MAFAEGDEIVTTDNEHAGLLEPLGALTRRYGVVVRVAEVLHGGDPLAAVAALIGPRTRVVALSHVLWANGRVLPLRAIADAAHAAGAPCSSTAPRAPARSTSTPRRSASTPTPGPGQKWLCGAERRRLPVGRGGLRGALRGRRAELLLARLPQRGRAVLARRAPSRRRIAHDRRARRADGRRGVPARARRLGRGRGARWPACARAASSCWPSVPGVTIQADSEGAAPLVAFTVEGHTAERGRRGARGRGHPRALAARPRLGARLARLLGLRQRSRAPRRRAARARVDAPGDFTLEREDGSRARRPADDGARRGRDARLHARRHARDGQGRRSARARAARRAGHPRQHLPPALPPRRRADRGARRPPPVHGLGAADPHRFRRLPGLLARRDAQDRRRRRHVPLGLRRLPGALHARARDGRAGLARLRHRDGLRRVRAGRRAARRARARRRAHRALGRALRRRAAARGPAALRHRPGRHRPRAARALGGPAHRRCRSRATRSAG